LKEGRKKISLTWKFLSNFLLLLRNPLWTQFFRFVVNQIYLLHRILKNYLFSVIYTWLGVVTQIISIGTSVELWCCRFFFSLLCFVILQRSILFDFEFQREKIQQRDIYTLWMRENWISSRISKFSKFLIFYSLQFLIISSLA
jgi:hypothetical protein